MRKLIVPLLLTLAAAPAVAQQNRPMASAAAPATAMQPSAGGAAASLPQVQQVVESARVNLAGLRIDKWKANSNVKHQEEANVESLQRNMTAALPAIADQVRANPGSVAAAFKLYRNLNALYDVMSTVTEAAGAYGSKEEYQALASDTMNLDNLRRSLADKVEAMAASRDTEITQLQMRARQAAAAAEPPKKIVIDDTEPAKKPAKKPVRKKKTTTASEQKPPE